MRKFLLLLATLIGLSACSPTEKKTTQPDTQVPQQQAPQQAQQPARDDAAFAKLLTPSALTETAPAQFTVAAQTTQGPIRITLYRDWAPRGVDRFYNLVKAGFFNDIALFRMAKGFVVQFGIHGTPIVSAAWKDANIPDDPVMQSNAKGTLVFATAGPNTRTTQLFINLADNTRLDSMGFAPIGKITQGMDIIENKLNYEYGERPDQGRIQKQGTRYLRESFPKLDYIQSMSIESEQ